MPNWNLLFTMAIDIYMNGENIPPVWTDRSNLGPLQDPWCNSMSCDQRKIGEVCQTLPLYLCCPFQWDICLQTKMWKGVDILAPYNLMKYTSRNHWRVLLLLRSNADICLPTVTAKPDLLWDDATPKQSEMLLIFKGEMWSLVRIRSESITIAQCLKMLFHV